MTVRKLATAVAVSALSFVPLANAQSAIAEAYCSAGQNILQGQTFMLRQQGIPIDTARKTMDTFLEDNPTLWQFMIQSVNSVYQDPDGMHFMINSGQWMALCIKTVRGY